MINTNKTTPRPGVLRSDGGKDYKQVEFFTPVSKS